MKKVTQTSKRKNDHLQINLEENVSSGITTGLENYYFEHQALPEINLREIDLKTSVLGKTIDAPIFISSMTGGSSETKNINRNLAIAANELNIPMGVGSQRAAIEDGNLENTFKVRDYAPNIPLFANLGAVQLNYGYGLNECQRAVDMINADALILHLNPLQEALQPEGDTDFSSLLPKIEKIAAKLSVPIIAKEVGWGISAETAEHLFNARVKFIDVAGAGGTSWSQIEKFRSEDQMQKEIADLFIDSGIPTSESIRAIKESNIPVSIFASGGLRTGLDAAKCMALGADICGFAGEILKSAVKSEEETINHLIKIKKEIQLTMFVIGSKNISELKNTQIKSKN